MNDNTINKVALILEVDSLFDEYAKEYAEDQGYETVDEYLKDLEEDISKSIAPAVFYRIVRDYVQNTVVYAFDVRISEKNNILGVYVEVENTYVDIAQLDDIDWFSLDMREFTNTAKMPIYFLLKDSIEFDEGYFFKLSRMIVPFLLLVKMDGKIVSQGYDDGEYNSGYFINDDENNEKYYISGSGNFDYEDSVEMLKNIYISEK